MGLKSSDNVLTRSKKYRHSEESPEKREVETECVLLQTKGCQEPSKPGKGKRCLKPIAFRVSMALTILE